MPDLLVRLYHLADAAPLASELVRRAFAAEKALLAQWVATEFGQGWASEAEAAFARMPVTCFVAVQQARLLGFACYDATARGFFGPFGVAQKARGRGLGRALLHATLRDMRAQGYAYAVIGAAGEIEFYRQEVGALEIPGSEPGFYRGFLKA